MAVIRDANDFPERATARIFLALWPDAKVRAGLAQYADAWAWPKGVARVRDAKLHLTLHFIGDVERQRLTELQRQLALPFDPFCLRLGYPDLWPHGIAVAQPHAIPEPLLHLQAELGGLLKASALTPETREFHPHVTLARRAHAAKPPAACLDIHWQVNGYALIESCFDAPRTYAILCRYSHNGVAT